MFRRLTAIAVLLIAGQTYAQSFIADTIPYAPEAKVADRIRQECTDLGANLSRKIIEQTKAGGIELQATSADSLAGQPDRLEVQITDARSYGSAFTGHYKSMHIRLTRYENSQQPATTELSRRSLGGMGGMFKSSCSVLERVTDTLAKDTAAWLKNPAASATPTASEASGAV
ncbi:hypothetical protein A7Q01_05530 [Eikenella sp. NML96-A-049]|uniref:hypothetical protein n=1 Tax=unclassified Eikenella TaxID=2639367 RepID=UPI0007E20527|nr:MULTISPECIES: hypothetical protein [unclassified Eikenella]OAM34183.1 hypothetical protein A7P97_02870 [Eikenella sp. NML070372]OAM38929.1 hypothetical protein A7Q01_05530 [Eikenella sp. NML96-A-049]VDH00833.1 Uncharacterised protein [Helicobacter pametensis]